MAFPSDYKRVQQAGGPTSDTAAHVGLARQLVVDTTQKKLYLHDGSTPGGFGILSDSEFDTKFALAETGTVAFVENNTDGEGDKNRTWKTSVIRALFDKIADTTVPASWLIKNAAMPDTMRDYAKQISDLNLAIETGHYRCDPSATANLPGTVSTGSTVQLFMLVMMQSATEGFQLLYIRDGSARRWIRDYSAGVFGSWVQEAGMTSTDLATRMPIAGGTFTGPVTLSGDPASALQPATKRYSDGARNQDDLIINGCFDVAQRGVSQIVAGYSSIDRWRISFVGGAVTQSREAFTLGDTIGSNAKPFFGRQTVSGQTLATHYAARIQSIEDVRSYSGQTITILGWARRASGAGNMSLELSQDFGTGGSPSAIVDSIGSQQVSLSSLWVPFAVVFNVPSVAGKTLGTNGNSNLNLLFWMSGGSNWNTRTANLGLQTIGVDLFGIHIRKGIVPVEAANYYSPLPIWQTERDCERYLKIVPQCLGVAVSTTVADFAVSYQAMRIAPSFTQVSNGVNLRVQGSTSNIGVTASALSVLKDSAVFSLTRLTGTWTAGNVVALTESGAIRLDAEL